MTQEDTAAAVIAGRAPWSVDVGDCLRWLRELPAGSVQCVVTSPPYYGLRDYGPEGQIGLEPSPGEYVSRLVEVFREARRVLREDGTLWLNLGDSTAGKDLLMVPARVALALQADGWYLRSEITLAKLSPMPESVRDRPTRATERLYLLTKSERYYYDQTAERVASTSRPQRRLTPHRIGRGDARQNGLTPPRAEPAADCSPDGRNLWDWWEWVSEPQKHAHYAAFPSWLPRRCLRLGASLKGCCPVCGAPHVRQVERVQRKRARPNDLTKRTGEEGTGNSCDNSVAGVSVETLGWAPPCDHEGLEPAPCVVLDPFTGSGTTGVVARDLGMRFLGCDINPEYAELARGRIGQANPLLDIADRSRGTP